ncbi:metal ABC transporter permease, partial [Escherichia coli]|nr:metal ABC transporter permease [Escherichia coli]
MSAAGSALFANVDWAEIGRAGVDTLAMLGGSLVLTVAVGLPLGVLLFLTGRGQLLAQPLAHGLLSVLVNV